MVVNESESTPYSMNSIHIWIVSIFSLQYIQCNERVKVLYILLCNIFNHMKKYKFQTDPSSEFQTRFSSELVSWHRTYFSKLDPVRNSELGAVWKMLPFKIMLHFRCRVVDAFNNMVLIPWAGNSGKVSNCRHRESAGGTNPKSPVSGGVNECAISQ